MEDNYIIITINDIEYYIPVSRVNDLAFIDNKLVNISDSSITMVHQFDYQNNYPRITCSAMSQCILRSNTTSNYIPVTSNYNLPDKFNMKTLGRDNLLILLIGLVFILVGIKLVSKR